jgi:hypothetical protein
VVVQPAEGFPDRLMQVGERLILAQLDGARHALDICEPGIESEGQSHAWTVVEFGGACSCRMLAQSGRVDEGR